MIGSTRSVNSVPCVSGDVGGRAVSQNYVIGSFTVVLGVGVHLRDYSAGRDLGVGARLETYSTTPGTHKREWSRSAVLAATALAEAKPRRPAPADQGLARQATGG
jgi:hypothetical protein